MKNDGFCAKVLVLFKGMIMPGLEDVHVDSDLFGMDLPDLDVKHGECSKF